MHVKCLALSALLLAAAWLLPVGEAAADDPIWVDAERGSHIAEFIRAHGFFCLQATTLKRMFILLDGRQTYRVACGPTGGAPLYKITVPAGQKLNL